MYEVWDGYNRKLTTWDEATCVAAIGTMDVLNVSERETVDGRRSVNVWFADPNSEYGESLARYIEK